MATSIKMAILWNEAPCSLIDIDYPDDDDGSNFP
jgi:hypothetical protein